MIPLLSVFQVVGCFLLYLANSYAYLLAAVSFAGDVFYICVCTYIFVYLSLCIYLYIRMYLFCIDNQYHYKFFSNVLL